MARADVRARLERLGRAALPLAVSVLAPACIAPVDLGGGSEAVGGDPPVNTRLPPAPALMNVIPSVHGDSVGIDFEPVDDAVDYRIYPLPADDDVTVNPDGSVTVRDAIYRCAGGRHTFDLQNSLNEGDPALERTRGEFSWNAVIPEVPTLGHVHVEPGPGRMPVYAVAGKATSDEAGWRESRVKLYTTDAAERDRWLAESYRDDGVVFYVPSAASPATRTIYGSTELFFGGPDGYQHYFDGSGLAERAGDEAPPAPAFEVLVEAAEDTRPLMAVGYANAGHDELVAGKERFHRAAYQGRGPLFHVHWSGLGEKTTLVVEALDAGCPYQGFVAASHVEAPPHQTFSTLAELRAASPTGEVFVNGQFDGETRPRALARSFVTVTPEKPAAWDWYEGFDGTGALDPVAELPPDGCFRCIRQRTSKFDMNADRIDHVNDVPVLAYGEVLGELWVGYDDSDGGTLGRVEFTAREKASIGDAGFLHVGFSTGIAATLRRFPQLIVSDREPPTEAGFRDPENDSVVLQIRGGPEVSLYLIPVHGVSAAGPWAVDNPATFATLNMTEPAPGVPAPFESPFEHAGIDRMTRFDVYVSPSRYYVWMDGKALACAVLPPELDLRGSVAVTFGDVFFHEGAEGEVCIEPRPYDFLHRHSCRESSRHFDDLGFTSGAPLPSWDESRLPCRNL